MTKVGEEKGSGGVTDAVGRRRIISGGEVDKDLLEVSVPRIHGAASLQDWSEVAAAAVSRIFFFPFAVVGVRDAGDGFSFVREIVAGGRERRRRKRQHLSIAGEEEKFGASSSFFFFDRGSIGWVVATLSLSLSLSLLHSLHFPSSPPLKP